MYQFDTHLAGRRATLGALHWELHQLLTRHHAVRVEVRYSSCSRECFDSDRAAKDIASLLRAHGQGAACVSVRRHPDAETDGSGAHLLRLFPSMHQPEPPAATAGWRAWLLPLLPGRSHWHERAWQPAQACQFTAPQAVARLRQAFQHAAADLQATTDDPTAPGCSSDSPVVLARVQVHSLALHHVLLQLVRQEPRVLQGLVRASGVWLQPGFSVDYAFRPAQDGDGTYYATASDVEVQLLCSRAGSVVRAESA